MLSINKKPLLRIALLTSMAIILFIAKSYSQTPKVNVSGSWIINIAKCQFGDLGADTTRQLDIKQIAADNVDVVVIYYVPAAHKDTLILNGQSQRKTEEWDTETGRGITTTTTTSKWADNGLSIIRTEVIEAKHPTLGFNSESTRIYQLSEDGKTLTIETSFPKNSLLKSATSKTVYEKKPGT